MKTSIKLCLVALPLVMSLAGCGGPKANPNIAVAVEDVPQPILAIAKKQFPDGKVITACKTPAGNFELYSQTKRGKLHLIVVSESGEIKETE